MSDVSFFHYLCGLPMVTMDEAYHAMLVLADGHDSGGNFEGRERLLQERGIARAAWHLEPDDALDNGTLAYMVARILKLRGGLNDWVLGSWGLGDRRYAQRTAVWGGVMPYRPAHYVVTGGELATTMTVADEYMAKAGMYAMSEAGGS